MKISNTHQRLSDNLKNTEVLTNPEPFLGPNWETVLRWWLYYESLTDEQENELYRRYCAIDRDTRKHAYDLARNATIEVIGADNRQVVWCVVPYPTTITYELIALHKLKEKGIQPTFLPLIDWKDKPQCPQPRLIREDFLPQPTLEETITDNYRIKKVVDFIRCEKRVRYFPQRKILWFFWAAIPGFPEYYFSFELSNSAILTYIDGIKCNETQYIPPKLNNGTR
jgi:hypothetical protein